MSAKLYLHFLQSNARFEVPSNKETLVGRAPSCDIHLSRYFDNYLQAVSRQHFKLFYQRGEGFVIVDLSYNGTYVNGNGLSKNNPRILRDGDLIKLARNEHLVIKVAIDEDPDVTDAIEDPDLFFQAGGNNVNPNLYLDKSTAQFVVGGKPIPHEYLTKLDVGLLTYFCNNAGRLCSFDDIAAHVWDDPAWMPENNTISRAVTNLRRKLNQFSAGTGDYIQNIRGQGYKLDTDA